jgi:hypothetical protein
VRAVPLLSQGARRTSKAAHIPYHPC